MVTIVSFVQKLIKGQVGIRVRGGGWKVFKIDNRGGDDYSVLESTELAVMFLTVKSLSR